MQTRTNQNIQSAILSLIEEVGETPNRDGLIETPARFEKQLRECLSGYADDPTKHLKLFGNKDFHSLVTVSNITFSSLCEHHLLPFYGSIDIAYIPCDKILGLSKFARITDAFSRRLQVQERLTQEIADFLMKNLKPELLIVRARATHSCMTIRGVLRPDSITETFVCLGDTAKHQNHISHFQNSVGR